VNTARFAFSFGFGSAFEGGGNAAANDDFFCVAAGAGEALAAGLIVTGEVSASLSLSYASRPPSIEVMVKRNIMSH
jgi:hypothetical protein